MPIYPFPNHPIRTNPHKHAYLSEEFHGYLEYALNGKAEDADLDYSILASIRLATARILLARHPVAEIPAAAADDEDGEARFVGEAEADTPEVVGVKDDEEETIVDLGVDGLADRVILAFSSKELMID